MDFTLEELKALRTITAANMNAPTAKPYWNSIFQKLSLAIADEVCREKPLEKIAFTEQPTSSSGK